MRWLSKETLLPGRITTSKDAADFFRTLFEKGEIEVQEQFLVAYLNNKQQLKGYYRHAKGGLTAVLSDARLIFAVALKSLSTGIMICHNHPSGDSKPSEQDTRLTNKVEEIGRLLNIRLLDSIILGSDNYFSYADNGLV